MTNIRQAAIDDCERLYLINRDSLGYDYAIEETRKRLSFVLSAKTNKLFVAEIDGVVAGYIHVADYDCIYADSLKNILALAVRGLALGVSCWKRRRSGREATEASAFGSCPE